MKYSLNNDTKSVAERIKHTGMRSGIVYICGNGGSASTSNHFANDLVKLCGIKAISLCANEAVVMAYANDNGYENIFTDQLKVFVDPLNDMLITISGSGTSPNIVKAIEYFKSFNGNAVIFPTMKRTGLDMQRVEDLHLKIVHKITDFLIK